MLFLCTFLHISCESSLLWTGRWKKNGVSVPSSGVYCNTCSPWSLIWITHLHFPKLELNPDRSGVVSEQGGDMEEGEGNSTVGIWRRGMESWRKKSLRTLFGSELSCCSVLRERYFSTLLPGTWLTISCRTPTLIPWSTMEGSLRYPGVWRTQAWSPSWSGKPGRMWPGGAVPGPCKYSSKSKKD